MMYLKQTAFLLVSPFSFQDLALWRDRLPLDFTRLHMHRLMIFTAIDLFYAQGQLSLLLTQISSTRKAISMVSPRHVTFSFKLLLDTISPAAIHSETSQKIIYGASCPAAILKLLFYITATNMHALIEMDVLRIYSSSSGGKA